MLKRLMTTTTALVALGGATAFAAEAGTDETRGVFDREMAADAATFYDADSAHMLATNLIGSYIYNGSGDEAESVGDVNDVVFSTEGEVMAVIAGVGGFLGIGEKEVAISIDRLNWRTGPDGERWLVGDLTSEQLNEAPGFDRTVITNREQAMMTDDRKPADETMAAADANTEADTMTGTETAADGDRTYVPLIETSFEADRLIGMDVHGANDEDVGEVGDVLIGGDGEVQAVIIDVGGFLGLGEKPVAVSLDNMMIARADDAFDWSVIKTSLTAEQLEQHQAFSRSEYESDPDAVILVTPAM
ncbi:MAG: PRC-barrel domain-containing protein [Roseitalea sp.]|jgi:sporulation protein YlmC with PRC-barrel domain|nr:PRC-barrel domain-containing protein [Roseitalea sp.]MBO6720738.1 PRC-barrel domain-containing protein [Roseitalea sp.]MBO6743885.1 PRC-barrel domain-containing protein [Roseitalea sp.]